MGPRSTPTTHDSRRSGTRMAQTFVSRRSRSFTAEELALLFREYEAWPMRGSNKAHGLMKHLQQYFPEVSWSCLKSQIRRLVRHGRVPRKVKIVRPISPLDLTQTELGWLAGIVDGEGSISLSKLKNKDYGSFVVHVVLCYNNDDGILDEVQRLVPFTARRTTTRKGSDSRGIVTKRDVYMVSTTSHRGAYEVLRVLLPYLHGRKRISALRVWEFVQSKVEKGTYGRHI